MRRNLYRVEWDAALKSWVVVITGRQAFSSKTEALRWAVENARNDSNELAEGTQMRWFAQPGPMIPAQVVIHGKDGRIQEERTYPRSSDPRRRKG